MFSPSKRLNQPTIAMTKLGISFSKKKNGIMKLKKLKKGLLLGRRWTTDSTCVPEDVKEGQFAVIAEYGEEPRRFVVPLSYLTHPRFLKLLEKAAEEYGFNHDGALTIPCQPSELETILADQGDSSNQKGAFLDRLMSLLVVV